mgnify:CR=1 FL=1
MLTASSRTSCRGVLERATEESALLTPRSNPGWQVRLNSAGSLHWRTWGDEYVVYDECSSQTHVLDALTACALLCIDAQGIDESSLISEVSLHAGLSVDSVTQALPFILDQLSEAALVDIIDR